MRDYSLFPKIDLDKICAMNNVDWLHFDSEFLYGKDWDGILSIDGVLKEYYDRLLQGKYSLSVANLELIFSNINYEYSIINKFRDIDVNWQEKIERLDLICLYLLKLYTDIADNKFKIKLLFGIKSEKVWLNILENNYEELRSQLRKTVIINETNGFSKKGKLVIEEAIKRNFGNDYTCYVIAEMDKDLVDKIYKYFGDIICFFDGHYSFSYDLDFIVQSYNFDYVFRFIQSKIHLYEYDEAVNIILDLEYKNITSKKHFLPWKKRTISLPDCLTLDEWIPFLEEPDRFKAIVKYLDKFAAKTSSNMQEINKSFISKYYNSILVELSKKIDFKEIELSSLYSIEYVKALTILKNDKKTLNKSNKLYDICFKLFVNEYKKECFAELNDKDIVYLDLVFKRFIIRGCIYDLFKLKNRNSLIFYYKTDIFLEKIDASEEFLVNFNVKRFKYLVSFYDCDNSRYEFVINALGLLEYKNILTIIKVDKENLIKIVSVLKDKDKLYVKKFNVCLSRMTSLEPVNLSLYLMVFDSLIKQGIEKITDYKIRKIIDNLEFLLVPYNKNIKENLRLLNFVAKGDIKLEKVIGIKLYDLYRKRLKTSIPDFEEINDFFTYGLVDMHDPDIISNGIGKYLLPNGKKASSCLTPNGKASSCLFHGATSPHGRFFAIKKDNKIVAYSWVWRAGDVLVFDNIEVTDEIYSIENRDEVIYKLYLFAAMNIVKETRKEANGGIKLVLIGRNKIDIQNAYIDSLKVSPKVFGPNNSENLYLKDSSEKQLILYGKYDEKLDTNDVLPTYYYKRKAVLRFKDVDRDVLMDKIDGIYYEYCLHNNCRYKKIDTYYVDGYLGEDWFAAKEKGGQFNFCYVSNDERLFVEAKKYLADCYIEPKSKCFYIPRYNPDIILDAKNIILDDVEINKYLKELETRDFDIKKEWFTHSTMSIELLNSIFKDGAITSADYGKRNNFGGHNGKYFISIAKVGSDAYNSYKGNGTILLDDRIFAIECGSTPYDIPISALSETYPIRPGVSGEYQVMNKITLDHARGLLALENDNLLLAQVLLLNEVYDLNLPLILEERRSVIDTQHLKKFISLHK